MHRCNMYIYFYMFAWQRAYHDRETKGTQIFLRGPTYKLFKWKNKASNPGPGPGSRLQRSGDRDWTRSVCKCGRVGNVMKMLPRNRCCYDTRGYLGWDWSRKTQVHKSNMNKARNDKITIVPREPKESSRYHFFAALHLVSKKQTFNCEPRSARMGGERAGAWLTNRSTTVWSICTHVCKRKTLSVRFAW